MNFQVSHRLVRGLDYYSRTTFEILTQGIGAQNAVLGGGRYDNLVKQLGGPDRAGMGFAAGVDRLILAMPEQESDSTSIDAFVVAIGDEARVSGQVLARDLREAGLRVLIEYEARSLRSQMKYADRSHAAYVLIVGDDELEFGNVTVKNMTTGEQSTVSRADVAGVLLSNEK